MKCLAQTQGSKVRVNAVLPGLLLTDWVSYPRLVWHGGGLRQTGSTISGRDNPRVSEHGRPEKSGTF